MQKSESHGKPEDPYRIFFPLGILMGFAGVIIWPLYHWNVISWYNGRSHAFVQADCFLYAFIVGFLWTAIPRFTGAAGPSRLTQYVVASLLIAQTIAFDLRQFPVGHALFVVSHIIVISVAGRCFVQRRHPPPETFVLVGFGLLSGLIAAFVNAGIAFELVSPDLDLIGRRLMTEGMVLLLVLGVGGFLGPRLLGFAQLPNFQNIGDLSETRRLPIGMRLKQPLYALAGAGMLLSLIFEYGANVPAFAWLWAAITSAIILSTIQPYRWPAVRTTLSWCVWTAFWLVIVASWLVVAIPKYRIDLLHVMFMGGFTLLVLAVGMRVVLSHRGHSLVAEQRSWPLRIGSSFVLFAMLTRLGAALAPGLYFSHLAWAALIWMVGMSVWVGVLWRKIRT
jgi:uncharacterized protein involved in response to NO